MKGAEVCLLSGVEAPTLTAIEQQTADVYLIDSKFGLHSFLFSQTLEVSLADVVAARLIHLLIVSRKRVSKIVELRYMNS